MPPRIRGQRLAAPRPSTIPLDYIRPPPRQSIRDLISLIGNYPHPIRYGPLRIYLRCTDEIGLWLKPSFSLHPPLAPYSVSYSMKIRLETYRHGRRWTRRRLGREIEPDRVSSSMEDTHPCQLLFSFLPWTCRRERERRERGDIGQHSRTNVVLLSLRGS